MILLLVVVCIVLLMVVCLALLGTMHEVAVLQGKVSGLHELLLNPPAPRFFNGMLPDRALARFRELEVTEGLAAFFAVFVRQGCPGCARLLEQIQAGVEAGTLDPNQFFCIVPGRAGGLDRQLRDARLPVVIDEDGLLVEACQVRQTPTMLRMDRDLKVIDSMVGGDMEWIQSYLTPQVTEHGLRTITG